MAKRLNRRQFTIVGSSFVVGATLSAQTTPEQAPPGAAADVFPLQPPAVVREVVTVAHFDAKRLRSLVDAQPALARAAVDWGFGDWEDALGAASHMGNREIAEYLLSKGARPTIFSAAMLGQLDVVKAFVQAQPGVQRIRGPHSISLLSHARAGGKQAQTVFDYLTALGDAGEPAAPQLTEEQAGLLTGTYVFGSQADQRIDITRKGTQLTLTRAGRIGRGLIYQGDNTFHPAGAEAVRIVFGDTGGSTLVTVHDPNLILSARRSQP